MEDGHFVAFRDTSFLPSLLAPTSQSLEVCSLARAMIVGISRIITTNLIKHIL